MLEKGIGVSVPSTIKIKSTPCKRVTLFTTDGRIYYDRPFEKPQTDYQFNIPDSGDYIAKLDCEGIISEHIFGLEPYTKKILLPAKEKTGSKMTGYDIIYNPNITSTPACVNVKTGIIYINDKFKSFPIYAQKFIIQHELGHRFYKTEQFCDIYATYKMLQKGYNQSSCVQALRNTLKRSSLATDRIETVFGALKS